MAGRWLAAAGVVVGAVASSCGTLEYRGPDGVVRVRPYDTIPASAVSVATGAGRVEWRAGATGRVWVGDDKRRQLLVNRPVLAGDSVVVDVDAQQVRVNDEVVYQQGLEAGHARSVFFR